MKDTHRSEFGYDGFGHRVEIHEFDADANGNWVSSTDTKFVWEGAEILESRTADGSTSLQRYYAQGFMDSDGTALYYTRDHLGSTRELVDAQGSIRARYDYDPWGRMTKIGGDKDSPFLFTGHLWHAYSGLYLTLYREYDANLGRWISRDPIEELGGINLYAYVEGDPIGGKDPFGLDTCKCDRKLGGGPAHPRHWYPTPTHTFIFTTNPDGSVAHTYSWGNTANTHGWNFDQPEDISAAREAVQHNEQEWIDNSSLDPFIQQAFDEMKNRANDHSNWIVTKNCKTEADKLIDRARHKRSSK